MRVLYTYYDLPLFSPLMFVVWKKKDFFKLLKEEELEFFALPFIIESYDFHHNPMLLCSQNEVKLVI